MPIAQFTAKLIDDRPSWDIKWTAEEDTRADHAKRNAHDESISLVDRFIGDRGAAAAVVLDIGCGNGRHLFRYKQAIGGRYVGLDFSARGLERIRQLDAEADVLNGDATCLPFADGTVDLILMSGVIYEIEDVSKHRVVFQEIERVLKQGGEAIFLNNSNLHLLDRLYARVPIYHRLLRKLAGKPPVDPRDLRFWFYRVGDREIKGHARGARLGVGGPIYCNVRSGLGRTWDMLLVTEDSYENDIRFKCNPLVQIAGRFLLGVGILYRNLSARTAVYFLRKG